MNTVELEYVPLRTPEGMVLYLKHTASEWMFRILPIRDPDQPRLWCLRIEACAGPSLSARTARIDPFYTSLAMTREQLVETLGGIRTTSSSWLDGSSQRELRSWLTRVVTMPIPHDFISPPIPGARTKPVAAPVLESAQSPAPQQDPL